MEIIIRDAAETLKNNLNFRQGDYRKKEHREFVIGIYNRFDELGLLLSSLKDISFNEAIKQLGLSEYMIKLKEIINE